MKFVFLFFDLIIIGMCVCRSDSNELPTYLFTYYAYDVNYILYSWLSRVSMRWYTERDIVLPFLSVCLSVCRIVSKRMQIVSV